MDFLLRCQVQNKPDNLLSLISWLESSNDVFQQAKNEFYRETSKANVNFVDNNIEKEDFVIVDCC
jgi:hypothetical protein